MNEEIRRARRSLGDAKDPNMKLLLLFVLLCHLGPAKVRAASWLRKTELFCQLT
jgi:hypothetical protein